MSESPQKPAGAVSRLRSLRSRILGANAGASLLGMAITLCVLALFEYRAAMHDFEDTAAIEARLIGDTVASSLVFGDAVSADGTLTTLRRRPGLAGVWIYDRENRLFASASAGTDEAATTVPGPVRSDREIPGTLETREPVLDRGVRVGTVVTRLSLAPVQQRLRLSMAVSGGILVLGLVGVLVLLAWRLLRLLRPLARLEAVMDDITTHGNYAMRAPDGGPDDVPDEIAKLGRVFNGMLDQIQKRDMALERELSERRRAEERLAHTAHHDAVTGLPNRRSFNEALEARLARTAGGIRPTALLFLDLDNFKMVNDTLGHDVGDALLAAVATRLAEQLRDGDVVYRLGGDEFAVILDRVADEDGALSAAAKLLEALFQPFTVRGDVIHTGTSIGVAIAGTHASTPEQLLKNADVAMYQAKSQGRGQVALYHAALDAGMARRTALAHDLRAALEQARLEVHYQPQIDALRRRAVAFDATLHWPHPRLGDLSHDELLMVAEDSGQIGALGSWLLRSACADCALWQAADLHGVGVSVSVTARQLAHGDFPAIVADALRASGLPPDRLELELREAAVLSRSAKVITGTLTELAALGVKLTLDAFATGHSSLTHLNRLPLDAVKLDATFVAGLPHDDEACSLADGILALAAKLGLKTSAEGVTNEAQAAFLTAHGCDRLQGPYFMAPQRLPDLIDSLATRYPDVAA
jgi:diguanylate cyclase